MQEYIYSPKNLYYRTNEFKIGRPVLVFVHGISGSSSAWKLYEEKFGQDYNILTFDLRGHGKSGKFKKLEDYEIKKFAEDLFDLVAFLKIEHFTLIGHSFGVLVVFSFLEKHLNMVEKLVLLSPSYAPNKILMSKILKPLFSLIGLLKIFPLNLERRGHVDYSKFINTSDWYIPRMIEDVGITSLHVYLYGSKNSYDVNYESLLDKIKIPTLIMHGQKDTIFPVAHAKFIHDKIKNSQLIILENSNHILVLNNFAEVSEAIIKFLK